MRNITAIVDASGKTDVTTRLIGYSGEHNAVSLEVGFTEEGLSLYSTADYFRIVIDGFYSDKLYLSQSNTVLYNLPQDVMKPPKVNCQLLGYKGDGSELSLILKSSVFSFQVDCSEVPFQKIDKGPDYFEEALHLCTVAAESASSSRDIAENCAKKASVSEHLAISNSEETSVKASEAAVSALRAERAAESVNANNLSNALKGSKMGGVVSLYDVSSLPHSVNVQLKNTDGLPCITGAQTIIEEVKIGTNDSGAYNWSDAAPNYIFTFPFQNEGVNNLKVTGSFSDKVYIAPIIDGQIAVGENEEVHWIWNTPGENTLLFTAEYTIVDGVLNYLIIYDWGFTVEGPQDRYETILGENQKITGFAVKVDNPDKAWISFSAEAENYKDVPVKVCGKNLFDKSKTLINGIKDETEIGVKAAKIIEHDDLVRCLKPNVEYTLSYEVECLSIPENATLREQAVGLTMRVKGGGIVVPVKYKKLQVGDVLNYISTFTLTEEQYNSGELEILAYGNEYIDNETGVYVRPKIIIRNIQIESGAKATEFEQYVEMTTYIVNPGEVLSVPSIYPSMTLFSKIEGVNIDVEYSMDINKSFKALKNAVVLLGGIIND